MMLSLFGIARLNDVDPLAWFTDEGVGIELTREPNFDLPLVNDAASVDLAA